jgi:tetratricopeptide (TPR) repeat protein
MNRHQRRAAQKRVAEESVERLFAAALDHHRADRQPEAEQLYRQLLTLEPNHAETLHLLGILAYQRGDFPQAIDIFGQAIAAKNDVPAYHNNRGNAFKLAGRGPEAIACYQHAIALQPDFITAYNNLGCALKDQGLLEAAEDCYRRGLGLDPSLVDLHNNLGIVLQAQGRRSEAKAAYRQAIALKPDCLEAHNNLGNTLRDEGAFEEAARAYRRALAFRPDWAEAWYNLAGVLDNWEHPEEAIAAYRQALALKPHFAEAYNNLGTLLKTRGLLDEAARCFQQALTINPNYAEAHNNLGNTLRDLGQLTEAVTHYRQAVALRPDYAEVHNNLGAILQDLGLTDQALAAYQQALLFRPDYAEVYYNLGVALQDRGLLEAAVVHYRRAIAIQPNFAEAHNNLGNALKDQGAFALAAEQYQQAIALRPQFAEAHFNRAELKTFQVDDPDIAVLEALVADQTPLAEHQAPFLHFALAKAWEEAGEPARAFQHLLTGNALRRQQLVYDEAADQALFQRVIAAFGPERFQRSEAVGEPSAIPIFVLGMPRSGSSLIEQCLASHPAIHGGGELPTLATVAGAGYPEIIQNLEDTAFRRLGAAYLARLPALPTGKTRLIDKMPYNFLYAGLIRLILPHARIIHTVRDPVETCVSCFSKLFPTGQLYSYDLGELGRYYRGYRTVMAHWHSVLPDDAMLDVSYEAVVEDFETQMRRVIAYCGLPWDDQCLEFHRTQRPVRTASAVQVRQPLFRTSLQRWRRYETWLAPLLRALAEPSEPISQASCTAYETTSAPGTLQRPA